MLAVLAAHWRVLLFRGVIAVLFGILALLWPGLTLVALVLLFGLYALLDGTLALVMAIGAKAVAGRGSLFIEAVVGITAGVVTFLSPRPTAIALLAIIAAWAILSGIASIAAAVTLRREVTGEWPLPLVGALSLLLGFLLILQSTAGAVALAWLIGLYAILSGLTLIVFALRMRQLSHEMARA